MTHGFRMYDASGVLRLSEADLAIQLVDVFEVDPVTSGSKNYQVAGAISLQTTQTQKEPSDVSTRSAMSPFNSVTATLSNAGSAWTLNWAPRHQVGTKLNVIVYVYTFIPT